MIKMGNKKNYNEKEKIKEKVGIGLKYKDGILLATYTRDVYVPKRKHKFPNNILMWMDYDDIERLEREYYSTPIWKPDVSVPSESEEVEIKLLTVFDRYSPPREKYLERKIGIAVIASTERVQKEIEDDIKSIVSHLRQLYDSPPSTNMIAKDLGKIVSIKSSGEEETGWKYFLNTQYKKPIYPAIILAGQDGKLITVSPEGKVTNDSNYSVAGIEKWRKVVYDRISKLYNDNLTLEEAVEIVKKSIEGLEDGNLELAIITKDDARKDLESLLKKELHGNK